MSCASCRTKVDTFVHGTSVGSELIGGLDFTLEIQVVEPSKINELPNRCAWRNLRHPSKKKRFRPLAGRKRRAFSSRFRDDFLERMRGLTFELEA